MELAAGESSASLDSREGEGPLRPDVDPTTWEPSEIAGHLLAGEGYALHRFSGFVQPSANQEPGYTLLLSFFLAVFPRPYIALVIFQVIAWLACAVVLGRVAERLIGAPKVWTTFVVGLWPPLVIYVLTYHPLWLRSSALILVRSKRMPSVPISWL